MRHGISMHHSKVLLQDLIEKTAKEIYDHQLQNRVVLGNPFSASIRDKCREAVPEALTLLLVSEVGPLIIDTIVSPLAIDQFVHDCMSAFVTSATLKSWRQQERDKPGLTC